MFARPLLALLSLLMVPAAPAQETPPANATKAQAPPARQPEAMVLTDRPVTTLDHPVLAGSSAGDPLRHHQWGLDQAQFPPAWAEATGEGTVVAVLDTGVDASHEDLAGNVLPGYDAIQGAPGATTDPNGHGTHVAGTIVAHTGNGRGVAGAAPGVHILPVRVLRADGTGRASDVAEGIMWAVDHGADVVNLSLGGPNTTAAEVAALAHARARGVLVVAAAGNEADSGNLPQYPAAHADVVAVAALTPERSRAPFSNFGPYVDLAAPGTGIVAPCPAGAASCRSSAGMPAGYARMSGTSMATPHVAAAAALLLSARPGLIAPAVEGLLLAGATDIGAPGWDPETGSGLVNPARALAASRPRTRSPAPSAPPPIAPAITSPAPTPTSGYWVFGRDGRVTAHGTASWLGDASTIPGRAPIVAAAVTPTGGGYWLAGADGSVFAFGDAVAAGSMAGQPLNASIVGMAATRSGRGYWLLSADGGIFTFGDARFHGSTGDQVLNRPVVDIAVTPGGGGYWLVASDGGVFTFGDAVFAGSTGGMFLNRPITSLAAAPGGYWLVAEDGGIFSFGGRFMGSLPGVPDAAGTTGRRIRATAGGDGYYILGTSGHVFSFGAALDAGWTPHPDAVDLMLVP